MNNNSVKFGIVSKVCEGYGFAKVIDEAGAITQKEVYLPFNSLVTVDESQPVPWLTNVQDTDTEVCVGDIVAFIYHRRPVLIGRGSAPAYKWGVLSTNSSSTSEGYNDPGMKMDLQFDQQSQGQEDPEIERLARSVCGQNGVKHHRPDERPAYSTPHRGVSNRTNPNQRQNRRRQYSSTQNHQNGDVGERDRGEQVVAGVTPILQQKDAPVYTVS